jgi:hypothetical protein
LECVFVSGEWIGTAIPYSVDNIAQEAPPLNERWRGLPAVLHLLLWQDMGTHDALFFTSQRSLGRIEKRVPTGVSWTGWGNTIDAIPAVCFNINSNSSKESVGADTVVFYHLNFLWS